MVAFFRWDAKDWRFKDNLPDGMRSQSKTFGFPAMPLLYCITLGQAGFLFQTSGSPFCEAKGCCGSFLFYILFFSVLISMEQQQQKYCLALKTNDYK